MRKMMWPALLLAACPLLPAQAKKASAEKAAVELKELETAFRAAYDQWMQAYMAAIEAEDDAKRRELLDAEPQGKFAADFLAAAEKYAGTDEAVPFLVWVCNNAYSNAQEALQTLLRDHLESAALASVVRMIPNIERENSLETLQMLVEKSPHAEVQAQALFTRADRDRQRSSTEAGREAAVADLRRVIELTGDANLKTRAKGAIFEMENLAVGLVAPEIEAEDLDGVKFKLSDYRGKVVMLDFWGDW